jgi:hypothetical protein
MMEDVNVPTPNPFIVVWSKGPECRAMMYQAAELYQALFREVAGRHARTGREVADTRVETLFEEGRWKSRFLVMVPYAAPEIFGAGQHPGSTHRHYQKASRDLNTVLDMMGKL